MLEPYKELPGKVYLFTGKHNVFLKPATESSEIDPNNIVCEYFDVEAVGDNIPRVDERIESFIREKGIVKREDSLTQDRLTNFMIAISEAVQNAILHGPKGTERLVHITILWIPGINLYAGVSDTLGQLDLGAINFSADEAGLDSCGRGVFLMTMLSSAVLYISSNDDEKEILIGLNLEKAENNG